MESIKEAQKTMTTKGEWEQFFNALGHISLKEWLMLNDHQRQAAADAGVDMLELMIGEQAKAISNLEYALHLCKDKEALELLQFQQLRASIGGGQGGGIPVANQPSSNPAPSVPHES